MQARLDTLKEIHKSIEKPLTEEWRINETL